MQADTHDTTAFGRREALGLLSALAFLAPRPGHAQATSGTAAKFDRAAFLDASGLVTGVKPADLTGLADALFAVFQSQGAATGEALGQLAALARTTPPANLAAAIAGTSLEPAAKALAAAWYTATVGSGPAARLLSYDDALAWKVAGFDATPGVCAGEFGFWAEPPALL